MENCVKTLKCEHIFSNTNKNCSFSFAKVNDDYKCIERAGLDLVNIKVLKELINWITRC